MAMDRKQLLILSSITVMVFLLTDLMRDATMQSRTPAIRPHPAYNQRLLKEEQQQLPQQQTKSSSHSAQLNLEQNLNLNPTELEQNQQKSEAPTLPQESDQSDCWRRLYEGNLRSKGPFELARTTMCAFSPQHPEEDEPLWKKDYTILLIGVHLGPPSDGKVNVPAAGYKFISMERRDYHHPGRIHGMLAKQYVPSDVAALQKEVWAAYKDHPNFQKADAIQCGFDTWHCLLFAAFNKKLILNSAYRFDGHIVNSRKELSADLQRVYDEVIRNNPDVVMGGTNLYDVMYHQHFFGSHKLIPIPAAGEYVRGKLVADFKTGKCPFREWNSESNIILVGPRRVSAGGAAVLKQIQAEIKGRRFTPKGDAKNAKDFTFKIKIGGYKYCDWYRYKAVVHIPYSIHSYTMVEVANLGIPVFLPSIKYMAELEKRYHIFGERKSYLGHGKLDIMKQNTRSLNFGFNPNDDFNVTATENWLYYSDFAYWEGTIFFDSIDDLLEKIQTTDYKKANEIMKKHRISNLFQSENNWQSVVRYLSDSPKSEIPKTFEEGMALWNKKISAPNFESNRPNISRNNDKSNSWIILSNFTKDMISSAPENFQILYMALDGNGEEEGNKLKEKIDLEGRTFKTARLDTQDFKDYKINKHDNIDLYSKLVQNGVLYLVTMGAERIEIPPIEGSRDAGTPYTKGAALSPLLPGTITYSYSDFWATIWSGMSRKGEFNQYVSSLWLQRLSWFLNGSPNAKIIKEISEDKLTNLSDKKKDLLRDLVAYLQYWKTEDNTQIPNRSFFTIVDQLTFELAVQGFMRKSQAEFIRDFLLDLVAAGYTVPEWRNTA